MNAVGTTPGSPSARNRLTVEIVDEDGHLIVPFSAATCHPLGGDHTKVRVTWKEAADLAPLCGRPVRLRFHLSQGKLYAFRISASEN